MRGIPSPVVRKYNGIVQEQAFLHKKPRVTNMWMNAVGVPPDNPIKKKCSRVIQK